MSHVIGRCAPPAAMVMGLVVAVVVEMDGAAMMVAVYGSTDLVSDANHGKILTSRTPRPLCLSLSLSLTHTHTHLPRMRLPSASVHSFANNCPLYFVKFRCGMVVYNDDAFVYAARLEDDTADVTAVGLEDASSSEDDVDSEEDLDDEKEEEGTEALPSTATKQSKDTFDAEDQARADRIEERRQHEEDGEGEPEELEEKVPPKQDNEDN